MKFDLPKSVQIIERPDKEELCSHWQRFFSYEPGQKGHSVAQNHVAYCYQRDPRRNDAVKFTDAIWELLLEVGYFILVEPDPMEQGYREYQEIMTAQECEI